MDLNFILSASCLALMSSDLGTSIARGSGLRIERADALIVFSGMGSARIEEKKTKESINEICILEVGLRSSEELFW